MPDFDLLQEDELRRRKNAVTKAMTSLNKREYDIFTKRKIEDPPVGLGELADLYGLSKERVRQIEGIALEKVKKAVLVFEKN